MRASKVTWADTSARKVFRAYQLGGASCRNARGCPDVKRVQSEQSGKKHAADTIRVEPHLCLTVEASSDQGHIGACVRIIAHHVVVDV